MSTRMLLTSGVLLLFIAIGVLLLVVRSIQSGRASQTSKAGDSPGPGLPGPFEPHMPEVDKRTPDDLAKVFEDAWTDSRLSTPVVVTPGRLLMKWPSDKAPGDLAPSAAELSSSLFGAARNLRIAVISFTELKAMMEDPTLKRAIPFLGLLFALSSVGHRVVAFEGHPSAFEIALRDADVLLVDDGMEPFLQRDWAIAARKAMKQTARILIHQRAGYRLTELSTGRR